MDVHAPHEPVHTWRDFAIHLIIVTIGLFIALSLEALVEHLHQRHLLHTAETNLHAELHDNHDYLADDEQHLDLTQAHLQHDVALLLARKSNPALPDTLNFGWHWDGLQDSAWTTARDSGALALMPFDTQQVGHRSMPSRVSSTNRPPSTSRTSTAPSPPPRAAASLNSPPRNSTR